MRVVLFGLHAYGTAAANALRASGHEVVGVVTKPDDRLLPSAMARWATAHGLPLAQPERVGAASFLAWLSTRAPDLIAVAGYHRRIPTAVLRIPTHGGINVHTSLLPAYRGPCPHKWVIINGESQTGVTVHAMTEAFDDGDILAQRAVPIGRDDTADMLFDRLTPVAAGLLAATVGALEHGVIQALPQPAADGSYYGYPTEQDAAIDWQASAEVIRNLVRGVTPRPGAWTQLGPDRIRITRVDVTAYSSTQSPGRVVEVGPLARVATGSHDLLVSTNPILEAHEVGAVFEKVLEKVSEKTLERADVG